MGLNVAYIYNSSLMYWSIWKKGIFALIQEYSRRVHRLTLKKPNETHRNQDDDGWSRWSYDKWKNDYKFMNDVNVWIGCECIERQAKLRL